MNQVLYLNVFLNYCLELKNALNYKWKLQNQDQNKAIKAKDQIQIGKNHINHKEVRRVVIKESDLKD